MSDLEKNPSVSSRMACRQFEVDFADYLEGESRPQVPLHAKACPFCSVILTDLELIRAEGRSFSVEEPPARLWANVRSTLAAEGVIRERAAGRFGIFAFPSFARLAAPLAMLACLLLFSSVLMVPPSSIDHSSTSRWLALSDRDAVAEKVFLLEDSALASMVGDMEKSFEARRTSLAPGVEATYRKGLESLDDSIRECRASVESEPGNTLAREYLTEAYTQKAEVLAAALKYDVP
jgi:hypothetical protein